MPQTQGFRPEPRDLVRAAQLLTRLPVSGGDGRRAAASAWAWPLIGAGLAAIQVALALALSAAGLPGAVAAGIGLALGVVATGALHEDGFADCADGFWGSHERARRLEILKDSRIGAYGVVALIFGIGLRWALWSALLATSPLALLLPAMAGRAAMAGVMAALPFARADGFARHVGRPETGTVALGAVITVLVGGGCIGIWPTLWTLIVVALAALAVARLARAKIGGQTGDVLGAVQVTSEIAALMTLSALIA